MTHQITRRGSIPQAMAWMLGLSVALFWLPVVGGLIAGYVGGRKAGGLGPAVVAVFLPGIALGLISFFLAALLGWIPIIGQLIGFLAVLGGFALSFMNVVPLMIGAVIGGITADR